MDKKNLIREAVILGALLHDIGKFVQRAGEKLDEKGKIDAERFCPKNKDGYPTHLHVIFSEREIERLLKDTQWENSANFALRHHLPDKYEDKLIQLADWLSAGERRDREPTEEVPEVNQEPLISIFSQIILDKPKIDEYYCPVVKIEKKIEKIYPKTKKTEAINEIYNFKNLWEEFKEESNLLTKEVSEFDILLSRILYLLEKYTLFVPSSAYKDKPEISLCHHLKSTAAVASCLYDFKVSEEEIQNVIEEIKNNWQGENLKRERFILLSGDISGIQDFIYSVTSEKALRGLRGRSFYLQLLSETIALRILDEFNLILCNLLFLGGGNFTILLPKIDDAQERIEKIKREIQENLFEAHKGKLGIILGYVEFSYEDFKLDKFGNVIEKLKEVLAREKRRKFKEILNYDFFEPFGTENKELKGCEICGEEIYEKEKCLLCESFEDLSDKIKNAKYIEIQRVSKQSIKETVNNWYEPLSALGYNYWFRSEKEVNKINYSNLVFSLNGTDFLNKNCSGFRFEAIYSPEGTLEDMANKAGDKEKGIKRWSALRMDVDDLGNIFSLGLRNKTISRFSMLSYMFSLFFSMGIREIIEEKYKDCCVVYSGGDDLFILAPWSDLPEIAQDIYESFKEYVCKHPKINLSGGIYIAPSKKFPVYHAAKEAGFAEDKAKLGDKNKITFLDNALTWKKIGEIKQVSDEIVKLLNLGMPRSLLTLLYAGYRDKKLFAEKKIPMFRIWRLFYAIKRLMERHKDFSGDLEDLRKKFITDFELMPELDISVRWAELLTR
ncbi:MAG: type III-A CRISPR-associated protein Cas10/Csm1, partial [Candidatus Omnitrophica bacterium]|nr:type III-A CRISPR-associated protein Cas10/Csm1 [Candidatus Omnitrophota bacterium]